MENFASDVKGAEDEEMLEKMIKLNYACTIYIGAIERLQIHSKIARIDCERLEKSIFDSFSDETAQELKRILKEAGIKNIKEADELYDFSACKRRQCH